MLTLGVVFEAGVDPQEIVLDETAAANPEEIDIDDADDASDNAEQTAEAAKQDMAEDNGMFQSEPLHNFSGVVQLDNNADASVPRRIADLDPALAAAMGPSQGSKVDQ